MPKGFTSADEAVFRANLERNRDRKAELFKVMVPKRSKYGNVKTVVDGIEFDSKREASRYHTLKAMLDAGEIKDLELQHEFHLIVNEYLIARYIADFVYKHPVTNTVVVEDAKGKRTPAYILKRKLMLACKGIKVKEV